MDFKIFLALLCFVPAIALAQIELGPAPLPPADVSKLPGRGPHPEFVTGGLTVNTSSREQVREFFNAVYPAAANVPINSTAVTAGCFAGTNSPLFLNATLLRINWYRAMAGLPASVTFNPAECTNDQNAAELMSANNQLQHVGSWTNWTCVTASGTNAAGNSNLDLGTNGAGAIDGYIWDFGANNNEVGHRRYILYPQTQVMGSGDVPTETAGTNVYYAANATWIFDANYFGPRPATTWPYVAWPPPGYVPFQMVFPQWSFALSNANLSAATVTMTSNGNPVAVTLQPYITGYGENTLVWYPSSLDPTVYNTVFPFSGTDTVYNITVSNIVTSAGTNHFTYAVTVFNPAAAGPGFAQSTINGTNTPSIGVGNHYACTPATNPNLTGYQWLVAQATNGNLTDTVQNGTTNFTLSPAPLYPVVIPAYYGTGNCFHLTHTNPAPLLMQLNETLFPATNATISFRSDLTYATSNEIARVQILTNNTGIWQDIFTQPGSGGSGQTTFTNYTLSLSNFVGSSLQIRFNYDQQSGSYYPQTNGYVGWSLQNIVLTNVQALLNFTTNSTASTNFTFTPTQTGNYVLMAQGVLFGAFPIDWSVADQVTAIVGPPVLVLKSPAITNNLVKLNFTQTAGAATNYTLLQASRVTGPWTTNTTATFTTNVAGSSWTFTVTNTPGSQFFRIQAH